MTTTLEQQPWYDQAACLKGNADRFFPEKGGSTRHAKRICGRCPVTAECLDYALAARRALRCLGRPFGEGTEAPQASEMSALRLP